MQLNILSAGAAQGVVMALAAQLKAETGAELHGSFGAVGAMRDKLLAGEPCDLIILTQALIAELAVHGQVAPQTAGDLGTVYTGVAVRTGDALPDVSTAESLRAALLASDGIYFPDAVKSTAGIHFAKVIDSLGIRDAVAGRLRTFPNGATAMRAMVNENAFDTDTHLIGCTQVTEINNTPGAALVGVLPKEFELATIYSVAVCTKASSTSSIALARRFAAMLTNDSSLALRSKHGYQFASI